MSRPTLRGSLLPFAALSSALLVLAFAAEGRAATIYVDDLMGDDRNDGAVDGFAQFGSGPVRSLRRASVLALIGDVIEIKNNGTPYYGSLSLVGGRTGGLPSVPLVVNGHGATFDGSVPVGRDAWRAVGRGLWRLDTEKKGWFQLIRDDAPVPEVKTDADGPPAPPAGSWTAWRGAIWYQTLPDELPPNEPFRIATEDAGVFLYAVRHVVVRDLTLRHYRLDGVNAADRVADAVLENVSSEANGRSGVFVGGCSRVTLLGGRTQANREASLLLRELGTADVRDAALDAKPVLTD